MQAVQATEGPVLLLAVPGSGKTTVLVSRLGYMIYCLGITPESILTVTYTVAATNDMRRRFAGMFGETDAERLEFRTINGISQKVLQYFARRTGKTPFQVADKEAVAVIRQSFLEVTGKYATENDIKETQLDITYAKNMRLTQEEIGKMDTDVDKFPEIFRTYNNKLRQMQMIDYDDQMIYALRILEQYPEVLAHFREKYRYFCVDEAQDTSKIQHDMIDLLAAQSRNLFMVGDEDQSIYGFRAAYPQAFISFEDRHQGARLLLIPQQTGDCPGGGCPDPAEQKQASEEDDRSQGSRRLCYRDQGGVQTGTVQLSTEGGAGLRAGDGGIVPEQRKRTSPDRPVGTKGTVLPGEKFGYDLFFPSGGQRYL